MICIIFYFFIVCYAAEIPRGAVSGRVWCQNQSRFVLFAVAPVASKSNGLHGTGRLKNLGKFPLLSRNEAMPEVRASMAKSVDLSSLMFIQNGAEPIRASSVRNPNRLIVLGSSKTQFCLPCVGLHGTVYVFYVSSPVVFTLIYRHTNCVSCCVECIFVILAPLGRPYCIQHKRSTLTFVERRSISVGAGMHRKYM